MTRIQPFSKIETTMNPIQAARKYCDCLLTDDLCLGITANDDLSPKRFRKEWLPCLLTAGKCQRCEHFESSILPMERRTEWPAKHDGEEFREAAHTYRMTSGALAQADRICPECNERALNPRERLCYICSKKRQLESKRLSASKSRNTVETKNVDS